jgi:DNA replication licensing factor MCM2
VQDLQEEEDGEGEDLYGETVEKHVSYMYCSRLLTINLSRDYDVDERLDRYSEQDIDDADVEETTGAQRRAAEAFMRRRDAREGRREGRRAA